MICHINQSNAPSPMSTTAPPKKAEKSPSKPRYSALPRFIIIPLSFTMQESTSWPYQQSVGRFTASNSVPSGKQLPAAELGATTKTPQHGSKGIAGGTYACTDARTCVQPGHPLPICGRLQYLFLTQHPKSHDDVQHHAVRSLSPFDAI